MTLNGVMPVIVRYFAELVLYCTPIQSSENPGYARETERKSNVLSLITRYMTTTTTTMMMMMAKMMTFYFRVR